MRVPFVLAQSDFAAIPDDLLKQLARLPTRSEVSWIALRLALAGFAGIGATYVLTARVGTLPTLVRAAPVAVRPPSSVGTLPSAVWTPSAIIVVRRAMRGNPSTPPPAPMAGHWVPTPRPNRILINSVGAAPFCARNSAISNSSTPLCRPSRHRGSRRRARRPSE